MKISKINVNLASQNWIINQFHSIFSLIYLHIHHIIVSKFIKDCNERGQTAFFISWSILVFWKRSSECCSNKSEKPTNVESQWNLLKLYVSKAFGLLNKNLIISCTPKRCNCLLSISKVCSQVLDSESYKPAFS